MRISPRSTPAPLAALSLASLFFTGCALTSTAPAPTSVAPAAIAGQVFGGQQPVKQSTVTVWSVGVTGYGSAATSLASTTTDNNGNFAFASTAYTCPASTTQVYVTAQGGNSGFGNNFNIALAAGLGNCSAAKTQTVNINEVTTAVTAFALAHFFTPTLGGASSDSFGAPADVTALARSNTYLIPALVNLPFGTVNPNTSTLTIESAKIYSIANTLAACVNTAGGAGACTTLFSNTTPSGSTTAPSDTLQAAVQMALHPYQNVSTLYNLAVGTGAPFIGLSSPPNDWTLGVAYTTPSLGLGIAANTSSNLDIDTTGRIWFPSNKPGAVGVAYFDPTANAFSGPFGGAIAAAPISVPQYLSIDQTAVVWLTDQASGNVVAINSLSPTQTGYFSVTARNGDPVTGGPISTDYDNTLYMVINLDGGSNLGQVDAPRQNFNGVGLFIDNPTGLAATYGEASFPWDIYASSSAAASPCLLEDNLVSTLGFYQYQDANTGSNCFSGGVALTSQDYDYLSVATTVNQLCSFNTGTCFAPAVPVNLPQGIAVDGLGTLWLANSGNASVSTLYGSSGALTDYTAISPVAYLHGSSSGATMTQPYGLAIDGAGNVWVSNAGCVSTSAAACTPGAFILSELIGAAAPTITPLALQFGGASAGTLPTITRPVAPTSSTRKSPAHNSQARPTTPSNPFTTTIHPL